MSTHLTRKHIFRLALWLTVLAVAVIFPEAASARPQDRKADADEIYKRAQKQYEKREFDEAIKLFNQVVKLDPTYVEAYVSRGMAWNEKGEYDKAIKDFTAGMQVDAKFVPAYINRGISWMEKSELDKALKDLDAAVKLDPKDDAALFHRGVARSRKGDYDAALEDFEASIQIDGRYAPVYFYRGQARYSKKEYEKALKDYDQSLDLDPKDTAVLNAKAWLLATCPVAKLRQGKTALELATKACELTGWKDVENLDTLSCACAEAGRFDEAVKWQKKVLAASETSQEAGDTARARLKLFEQKKAYRDDGK
jgi:tetratricopeptide (TPR) repeat protein